MPNFSAGGIATPADAALMMQLGAEAVFVGSGIFMKDGATALDLSIKTEREEAESRAKAIVMATTHYEDPKVLAEVSETIDLDEGAGRGGDPGERFAADERLVNRNW